MRLGNGRTRRQLAHERLVLLVAVERPHLVQSGEHGVVQPHLRRGAESLGAGRSRGGGAQQGRRAAAGAAGRRGSARARWGRAPWACRGPWAGGGKGEGGGGRKGGRGADQVFGRGSLAAAGRPLALAQPSEEEEVAARLLAITESATTSPLAAEQRGALCDDRVVQLLPQQRGLQREQARLGRARLGALLALLGLPQLEPHLKNSS